MQRLLLIDASPYIFRAYYSIPTSIVDAENRPTNAVYGFAAFLCQLLEQERPEFVAVAYDESLTTSFRNEIFPEYKAQRELPPPELEYQMQRCQELTRAMGLPSFVDRRYEADDIIGTLAHRLRDNGLRVTIVTNDKDLTQLLRAGDMWWDYARDRRLDEEGVQQHFGVRPDQIVDMLALMGDKVDNIPGVPGIGPQTAAKLLQVFGSVEALFHRLDELPNQKIRGAARLAERLQQHQQQVWLSLRLARIATDAPVTASLNDLRWQPPDAAKLDALFDQLGFGTGIRERIKSLMQIHHTQ